MANTKTAKIEAEIEKTKAKISELQAKQRELEQKLIETENSEIVDIVRGMRISLEELPLLLQKLKSGQFVPNGDLTKSKDFVGRESKTERANFGGYAAEEAQAESLLTKEADE